MGREKVWFPMSIKNSVSVVPVPCLSYKMKRNFLENNFLGHIASLRKQLLPNIKHSNIMFVIYVVYVLHLEISSS